MFIGNECGMNETSNENTYLGNKSGTTASQGSNTFIGFESGRYSSGAQNVYIGNGVCSSTGSSGSYNLFAGSEAGYHNQSGSGNVFLGPVSGSANTNGAWNTFVGQASGSGNRSGSNHTFIGANSGNSAISGSNSICIGDNADTSSDEPINQIVIGQGVTSYGNNTITFPTNLKNFAPGTEVSFSNSGGGCLYPVSSSLRWKTKIEDISRFIDTSKLYDLRPVTYAPKDDESKLCVGLIAEEVNDHFPSIVPKDSQGNPASVQYSLLSVIILEELKKLKLDLDRELNLLKKDLQ